MAIVQPIQNLNWLEQCYCVPRLTLRWVGTTAAALCEPRCCWYSNKEHEWPCVIPALPTHLSTMLRRPPPQIYAKHTDTAPSLTSPQFPSLSHTATHTSLRSPLSTDDLNPITLIEQHRHSKGLLQKTKQTKKKPHKTKDYRWEEWCWGERHVFRGVAKICIV